MGGGGHMLHIIIILTNEITAANSRILTNRSSNCSNTKVRRLFPEKKTRLQLKTHSIYIQSDYGLY